MDTGDIIYIRKQNVINEVAYYTASDNLLANGPPTPNGGWLIEVTYIDSDTTPFSFAGNDYYIGYVKKGANGTNGSNGVDGDDGQLVMMRILLYGHLLPQLDHLFQDKENLY